jgi:hypothetical protein
MFEYSFVFHTSFLCDYTPSRYCPHLWVAEYRNFWMKFTIFVPDFSLAARYREYSGASKFVSSGGDTKGWWCGGG